MSERWLRVAVVCGCLGSPLSTQELSHIDIAWTAERLPESVQDGRLLALPWRGHPLVAGLAFEHRPTSVVLLPAEARAELPETEAAACRPTPSPFTAAASTDVPAAGALIGDVLVRNVNVFDPNAPGEDRWLYRLANRLHWRTRVPVLCRQLLFAPGDPFDPRVLAESERLLRAKRYLHDAEVRPVAVHDAPGVPQRVDIGVTTRDDWTLVVGGGIGRSGGTNETHLNLRDSNFLGTGRYVAVARDSNVDRTATELAYVDDNLLGRHGRLEINWSDNSDGHERRLILGRPFYALTARWGAGLTVQDLARVDRRYSLGHAFDAFGLDRRALEVWGGSSNGLNAAGRAIRYSWGYTWTEDRFRAVAGTHAPLPSGQKLAYPWVGLELAQEAFRKERNLDQMGRTEDIFLGHRASFRLGLASPAVGADHTAAVFAASANRGREVSATTTILYSANASGRLAGAGGENIQAGGSVRLLHRNFGRHLVVVSLAVDATHELDAGAQLLLGGDSGLRGYPLRYQDGSSRVLLTLEQRFFTNWYPFRLVHIGAAAFADVGRTFGDPAIPGTQQGWLEDVGLGLRLAPSRSGLGAVIHVDLAMPLDGDRSIDRLQWLVRTRASF